MFIQLFESVKITKGYQQSIITDVQSGFVNFIPNEFYSLLSDKYVDYSLLQEKMSPEDKETVHEYLNFIVENRLGILLNSKSQLDCFTDKDEFTENRSLVDYMILDVDSNFSYDIVMKIIEEIKSVNIRFLQIRVSDNVSLPFTNQLLNNLEELEDSAINEVSVVLPFNKLLHEGISQGKIKIKSSKYLQLVFYSSPEDNYQELGSILVYFITKKFYFPLGCGVINLQNFTINRFFHVEAIQNNTCLNKKISIDSQGNIRNCPAMPQSFGNIKDTSLEEALGHPDFKKYWNITKDHVEVCKDCEFRYICTDCRAYTERNHQNADGLDTSKPLKCGYNPYTGEWKEWSTNPLKQKAIKFYGMQDMVKKNEA